MDRPVRLQLSRRKGFDLQALSRETNGLEAIQVTRPGIWGNPFVVTENVRPGAGVGGSYTAVPTIEDAVECYAEMMVTEAMPGQRAYELRQRLSSLRGKNLACWCKLGDPCHADVLLEMANGPICEAVEPRALALPDQDRR